MHRSMGKPLPLLLSAGPRFEPCCTHQLFTLIQILTRSIRARPWRQKSCNHYKLFDSSRIPGGVLSHQQFALPFWRRRSIWNDLARIAGSALTPKLPTVSISVRASNNERPLLGEVFVRAIPVGSRKKGISPSKKTSSVKRKTTQRQVNFRSENWYERTAQLLSIPLDRRVQRHGR